MIDVGVVLGAVGFLIAVLSLVYSHNQAAASRAQVKSARAKAVDALAAAELVAEGARKQAAEALHAAGLVAEGARRQAIEALRAAELLATAEVSARVREMRARNLRANPNLPPEVQALILEAGGPDAYSVLLDSLDISHEIYLLRKRGLVSDEHWRMWMHDQMVLIASSPSFEQAFQRAVAQDVLSAEFVDAFRPVLRGEPMSDPSRGLVPLAVAGSVQVAVGVPQRQ